MSKTARPHSIKIRCGTIIPKTIVSGLLGKKVPLHGGGKASKSYIHARDLGKAIHLVSEKSPFGKIYNVGSGKTISVNKIVKLLGGKKIHIPKRPGEPDCTFADINKIKKDLKWKPKITIEEGIKRLIKNLDYWKKGPVWTPSLIKKQTKSWYKYLK